MSYSGNSFAFDTWTVPVLGGQPARFLPNATSLSWITDQQMLFAEIKTGVDAIVAEAARQAGVRGACAKQDIGSVVEAVDVLLHDKTYFPAISAGHTA